MVSIVYIIMQSQTSNIFLIKNYILVQWYDKDQESWEKYDKIYIFVSDLVWQTQLMIIKGWIFVLSV